jgi:hypothetical protein
MLDQPLDALIKKKKKVDTLAKKKTPKAGGIPTTPKTGKKLNKPEGKEIVKGTKKGGGTQKTKSGPAAVVKAGRGAAVNKATTGRAAPVTTKATPRGGNVPARGGAAVRGAAKGGPKNTRGGIRNNVMTQPKQEFIQPTRQQTQRGGRGGFTPNAVNRTAFKKKAPFSFGNINIPQNMSISIKNDQYQEQFQQPPQQQLFQQQQPPQQQQQQDNEDTFRITHRALNQKPIEFEEIDSSGTHKLKTLDSIFKSIHSNTKQNS